MDFPQRFSNLPEYAFPRLRTLLGDLAPGHARPIEMTIGSPRHAMPGFVADEINAHMEGFRGYPPNEGAPELLAAISAWIRRRYGADVGPERLIALNGTREGLFNSCLALCPETKNGAQPLVLLPNPFYQVYAVAALSAIATPHYVNATEASGHLPDFAALPEAVLERTAIAYVCSPANPQGAVADAAYWSGLIALAERYDFLIFADECYAEVYVDAPPTGILEVAEQIGADPERIIAFHSLSKRSNLAGLRSGFAAAGPKNMAQMRQLRAYAGAPLPLPLQRVAARAWADETHVAASRALYAEKFAIAAEILGDLPGVTIPSAGFFLWLPVSDGETAAKKLWQEVGVKVLPGAYLARETPQGNPGTRFIRVALVGPPEETRKGLTRLRNCLYV